MRRSGVRIPLAPPQTQGSNLAIVDGFGSGFVAVVGPSEGVGVDLGVEEHFEGVVVLDAELVVFVDVDLGEEGLVAQAAAGVVAAGVDLGAVGEQVEGVVEVGSGVGSYTSTVLGSGPSHMGRGDTADRADCD